MPWITEYEPGIGETICKILKRGNFREMACAQVGITSQTLRNWIRRGVGADGAEPFVQFVIDLEKAEAEGEDLLLMGMRRAGKDDWRSYAWILERLGSQRWGYKAQTQVDVQKELSRILEKVQKVLGADAAARVFAALADSEPGAVPDEPHRGRPPPAGTGPDRGVH